MVKVYASFVYWREQSHRSKTQVRTEVEEFTRRGGRYKRKKRFHI